MLKELIDKICSHCKDKEEVIDFLVALRLVDIKSLKYLLIHQYFIKMLSQNYSIMDATSLTAEEYNISERQVHRVRKWWKVKSNLTNLVEHHT